MKKMSKNKRGSKERSFQKVPNSERTAGKHAPTGVVWVMGEKSGHRHFAPLGSFPDDSPSFPSLMGTLPSEWSHLEAMT